ncbi:MAG TPA: T9SS type A sorting domain-containing protein, partial [Candidatus Krumholzibacteria bacterium]|nr:T9SS type A sorting domain-containing protein [Candidatus Krumholzibacteria bacterium]
EDSLNHRSRVYLAASDDGSGSFLRNVPVADEPSNNGVSNPARYPGNFLEYIGVAGWGDEAFVAWTDTRNAPTPPTDFYFDRVTGDEQPPVVSVTLDRDVLWPPDGRWEEVRAEVTISGGSEPNPSFVLHSVSHDEEPADGDVLDAEVDTPDLSFRLRAARRGKGDGRVYTVVYRAVGAWGGIARASASVVVPHDGSRAVRALPPGGEGAAPVAGIRSVEPNPFHGSAVIRYETRAPGRVRLTAYDVRGREVAVLVDEYRPAGPHAVTWDGRGFGSGGSALPVASGVYLLRMESSGVRSTRRVILLH